MLRSGRKAKLSNKFNAIGPMSQHKLLLIFDIGMDEVAEQPRVVLHEVHLCLNCAGVGLKAEDCSTLSSQSMICLKYPQNHPKA
jgi:hypothetical protein